MKEDLLVFHHNQYNISGFNPWPPGVLRIVPLHHHDRNSSSLFQFNYLTTFCSSLLEHHFLVFYIHGQHGFSFSLKYNSTIQFLFKIKLAGVITEYMPTSVKFSHCHNIFFIWLAENTRKILVKNANISWSKIFLISPCHAKKDAEFRLWLLLLSIFSHRLFHSRDVSAYHFLF